MHEDRILRDTQIVIDLSRIAKNIKLIKNMIGPDVALMAVVKANAYGLGALPIAPIIIENESNLYMPFVLASFAL